MPEFRCFVTPSVNAVRDLEPCTFPTWDDFVEQLLGDPPRQVMGTNAKKDNKRNHMAALALVSLKDNDAYKPRQGNNIDRVWGACLDIDKGLDKDWQQWLNARPFAHAWYTTASHTDAKPRVRVLVPFKYPINAEGYKAVWLALNEEFDGRLDSQAKDAARLGFLPGYVWDDEQPFECDVSDSATLYVPSGAKAQPSTPRPSRTATNIDDLGLLIDVASKRHKHPATTLHGSILLRLIALSTEDSSSMKPTRRPYKAQDVNISWPAGARHDKLRDALFSLVSQTTFDLDRFGNFDDVWPYLSTRCALLAEQTRSDEFTEDNLRTMWTSAVTKVAQYREEKKQEVLSRYLTEAPYTEEQLTQWVHRYEGLQDIEDLAKKALLSTSSGGLYVFIDGTWRLRKNKEDLYQSLGRFGDAIPLFELINGNLTLKTPTSLIRDQAYLIGDVATSLVGPYGLVQEHTEYGQTLPRLVQPPGHRRAWKQPRHDEAIDKWLQMVFGPHKEMIDKWISLSQDHSRAMPALYIVGETTIGKSLFRGGLGRLWGRGQTGTLDKDYFGTYNGPFERCPYVFVDDKTPHPDTTTGNIRDFITTRQHMLNPKYEPGKTVEGHGRLIILANNPTAISLGKDEMLTEADIDAIQQRFLFLDVRSKDNEGKAHMQKIRDYLRSLLTDVKDARELLADRVAQHFYWLGKQTHEPYDDASQFGFPKHVGSELIPYLSRGSSAASWAAQFLLSYCVHHADNDLRWLAIARIGEVFKPEFHEMDGEIYMDVPTVLVTSGFRPLLERTDRMEDFPRRIPSASEFEWALVGLSEGDVEDTPQSGLRYLIPLSTIRERALDAGRLTREKVHIIKSRLTTQVAGR